MPAAEVEERASEYERIVDWRLKVFLEAGFESEDAKVLASRFDIDLHYAVDLVAKGCTHPLALEILL